MPNQQLKIVYGQLELSLTNQRIRIGRANQLELMIAGDPLVSSHHCMIEQSINPSNNHSINPTTGQSNNPLIYQLIDHQSTNGTLVNGVRIPYHKPKPLKIGDIITVGETRLFVKEGRPYDQVSNQSIEQANKQANDLSNKQSIIKKSYPLEKANRLTRSAIPPSINLSSIYKSPTLSASQSNDKPPPTRLSSPTHPQRSVSGNDKPYLTSERSTNQSITSFYPDHFAVDESFDQFDSITDHIVDETFTQSAFQSGDHSTDDETVYSFDRSLDSLDNQTIDQSNDQHDEVVRLKDALRVASIKQNRLEKKLSDARRKHSVNQSISQSMSETNQKLLAYESMIDALKYQLLYGDSVKDQQIDCLIDRLNNPSNHQENGQSINQSNNLSNNQIYNDSVHRSKSLIDRLIDQATSDHDQSLLDQSNLLDETRDANDQSINQSINQSTSQSIYQSVIETRHELINAVKLCETQYQSINQMINQSQEQVEFSQDALFNDQTNNHIIFYQQLQSNNESIRQSINQSIDQLTKQMQTVEQNLNADDQSNNHSITHTRKQSFEQEVIKQLAEVPVEPLIEQSINQPINQSITQSTDKSIDAKLQSIQQSIQYVWFMMVALIAISVAIAALR